MGDAELLRTSMEDVEIPGDLLEVAAESAKPGIFKLRESMLRCKGMNQKCGLFQ